MWKWPGLEVRVRVSTLGLGALVLFVVVAVLFGDPGRDVAGLLKDWQTLIAGLLAIVAAWITLLGPREQIRQADRLAEAIRKREEMAARALMPSALNIIGDYVTACTRLLEMKFAADGHVANPIVLPLFDTTSLTVVSACIRYAPTVQSTRMAALLSNLQILNANAVAATPYYPPHGLFIRAANCQWLLELVWNYSRERPEDHPADSPLEAPPDFIRRTQFFSPMHDGFWPDLEPYLKRIEERQTEQNAPPPPSA